MIRSLLTIVCCCVYRAGRKIGAGGEMMRGVRDGIKSCLFVCRRPCTSAANQASPPTTVLFDIGLSNVSREGKTYSPQADNACNSRKISTA